MKEIKIDDRILQYRVFLDAGEYGDNYLTQFYEGKEIVKKRAGFLGLFGPKVEVEQPKKVFAIYEDAENPKLTKAWWKVRIAAELELLNRKEQLERGELI